MAENNYQFSRPLVPKMQQIDDRFIVNMNLRNVNRTDELYDTVDTTFLDKISLPCRWIKPGKNNASVCYFAWIEFILGTMC